ncbi:MAG: hypothetical protein A2Y10_03430 [Planctomycetes bacterium GWF2_41_51]|nr:MAG: hypothetical protein A2Y10_03430 [Planctomycetes bacterium GWF2_41_51]
MIKLIYKTPFDPLAWPGNWVWTQDSGSSFEVVQFCTYFPSKASLPVRLHLSADNRYKLYLNGKFIGLGPQRGSLDRYFFDTYDFSSLKSESGPYVISAVVWYDRDTAPTGQVSSRPGFLGVLEYLDGKIRCTPELWKYRRWLGNQTLPLPEHALCIGAGYDMVGYTLDDHCPSKEVFEKEYKPVKVLGLARDHLKEKHPQLLLQWNLFPRTLPALKAETFGLGNCRRVIIDGIASEKGDLQNKISFLAKNSSNNSESIVVPANSKYKIILDKEVLVVGYPKLKVSGGDGACIDVTYQEGLQLNDDVKSKGNRNEVGNRIMVGITDRLRLQGKDDIIFEPLWCRCWRYIELDIQTKQQPLELKELSYRSTGYPNEIKSTFEADSWFSRLIEPGIRTFELCTNETYFDCPYYEQVQYIGDSRIEALLSYVISNDDRLAREAIDAFDRSRLPNGLTQGGYPIRGVSELPLFSLIYIAMLNDFLMWRGDVDFIRRYMLGVETILYYFNSLIKADGLVGRKTLRKEKSCLYAPEWYIVDATNHPAWPNGEPPGSSEGNSFIVSFFYLYALQQSINIYRVMGNIERADQLEMQAKNIRDILRKKAFDPDRQIFIDEPSGLHLSQHTNILAILTDTYLGVVDGQILMDNILNNPIVVKATVYFKFYLYEAMYHIGRTDLIWPDLKLWHDMLDNGLTTFLEKPEPSRSDCHGWSSHPLYHFIASILGVRPKVPGCSSLTIKPLLNIKTNPPLPQILAAKFPTPNGDCYLRLTACKDGWDIYKEIPPEIATFDSELFD